MAAFEYEFDPGEERVISGVALGTRFASIGMIALGTLYTAALICYFMIKREYHDLPLAESLERDALRSQMEILDPIASATIFIAPLCFFLGIMLLKSAGRFQAVIKTEGEDIAHLMSAMSYFSVYFKFMGFASLMMLAVLVMFSMGLAFVSSF